MARHSHFGWVGVLALCAPAAAQQLPDAGSLRQQIESSQTPQIPKPTTVRPVVPSAPAPAAGEATVVVRAFEFTGNTRYGQPELAAVVAGYLNRPLNFAALQAAAAEVGNYYRQRGWVVRTYLPRQEVGEGRVTIHVVEAVFGHPEFEGGRPRAIALEAVRDRLERQVQGGEPLNLDQLDRSLLLIDDLPGVRLGARLDAGAGDRQTNVVLAVEDEPWLDGAAGLDNAGSRSTGEVRATGHLNLNSPFGRGELVQAQAMVSQGTTFARLAYQQPVGLTAWRAGVSASYLRYRLVGDEFEALDAEGASGSVGVDATYPVLRSRQTNLAFGLAAERKRFDNQVGGATTSRYRVDTVTASLAGNRAGGLWLGDALQGQVVAVFGRVDLAGSPNAAADAATTDTDGAFFKLRFALQNDYTLGARHSAAVALSGQLASKNLDSSERFFLGGPNGVRAYPVSEGAGSQGLLASAEARWQLPERLLAAGFVDWGMVQVNRDNDFPGASGNNRYALAGVGASLAWQGPRRVNARLVWAHRVGNNPNAGPTGQDQDGSLVKHRFWFSLQMPFEI